MVSKLKNSSKKIQSPKGHAKNPNYKGKNYKTPEKKVYVNKIKELLENPLKDINDNDKKVQSLIKVTKTLEKIKTPVKIESKKFNDFIKRIDNQAYKKILIAIPIIIYRLASLVVINASIFEVIFKAYQGQISTNNWANLSLITKINRIIKDYMQLIFKKQSILGYAELILLAGIVVDDIPRILLNTDYENVQDIAALQLAKKLAETTKKIDKVYEKPIKEAENEKEKQIIHELGEDIKNLKYKLDNGLGPDGQGINYAIQDGAIKKYNEKRNINPPKYSPVKLPEGLTEYDFRPKTPSKSGSPISSKSGSPISSKKSPISSKKSSISSLKSISSKKSSSKTGSPNSSTSSGSMHILRKKSI